MFNLEQKFNGLSLKSWIIISGLLIIFYYFVFTRDSTTCVTPTPTPTLTTTPIFIPIPNPISNPISNPKVELTKEKFINSENKMSNLIKVYNFNTSWCGYSVRFQPEWKKFENEIQSRNDNIQAFDIKCDNVSNKQMCVNYEIPGFPTIIIEKNNKKIDYNGPRTSEALIEYIENL